jgi:hypothetical protein
MSEQATTQEASVQPETQEEKALRDLQSDMQLVMKDLLTGQEMRHSVTPAASDFANATGGAVAPSSTLSILTNWHNQGLVFSKIPNDEYATDGVQYRWKLNWNGYLAARDLTGPVATLTSISPTAGVQNTQVTITATGTEFDSHSFIAVDGGAVVMNQQFVSATELTADVVLPVTDVDLTLNVTVNNQTWGTVTAPQSFTVELSPAPTLTTLSPATAVHAGVALTLTVDGTGFESGCTVLWQGSQRTTTFVSATQVTADITAADIAAAGTAVVTAKNPGSVASNSLDFTIT